MYEKCNQQQQRREERDVFISKWCFCNRKRRLRWRWSGAPGWTRVIWSENIFRVVVKMGIEMIRKRFGEWVDELLSRPDEKLRELSPRHKRQISDPSSGPLIVVPNFLRSIKIRIALRAGEWKMKSSVEWLRHLLMNIFCYPVRKSHLSNHVLEWTKPFFFGKIT